MTPAKPSILHKIRALGLPERVWFNALWFQLTWFLCVLGQDSLLPLTLAMIGLHFVLVADAGREARNLAPMIALGVIVDSLLSAVGVFDFGGVLVPVWLCLLWVAFATTLTRALATFGRHPLVAAVIGGIGVPANYAVGARLGAVDLPLEPFMTAAVLISVWAALLPGLYALAKPAACPREVS